MTMQQQTEPGWGERLKRYALILIPVIIAVWLWNIATDARATALINAEAVQVPRFELALVPGGPERFEETFEEAVTDLEDEEAFDATQYLWSTYVVRNIGERDAVDVTFDVTAAVPIDRLLFTPPGYFGNDATIEHEANSNTASVELEELGANDEVLLFVGVSPQEFNQPYNNEVKRAWARDFELYFEKLELDSNEADATLYNDGYVALYEQEEAPESSLTD